MRHGLQDLLVLAYMCGLASAQSTTSVSVNAAGAQGNNGSYFPTISADGRYVAFASGASDLVTGDTNARADIFVRDRQLGTTERVSVSSAGTQANNDSYVPSISADGRFVAFDSNAVNLIHGEDYVFRNIFVRDRRLGTTERVNLSSSGVEANSACFYASISADGRFVAFASDAISLVPGFGGNSSIFVHDRQLGTTESVCMSSSGVHANGVSDHRAALSADGRYVAFLSLATNLVANDTNATSDIFVRDRLLGTTERVSVSSSGAQADGSSDNASISADGRFVAFSSFADNLVAGDTNGAPDVFVRDQLLGTTELVSVSSSGAQANGQAMQLAISADGRCVAFWDWASNLVAGDTNATLDLFVRDLQLGTTERVNVSSGGAQAGNGLPLGYAPAISADGRFVAFQSGASNLVANDTNGTSDAFVRDRFGSGVAYCFGDGTGTTCPCGNAGPAGAGCTNSLGRAGTLIASGSASLGADTLVLSGSGMANGSALYFQGTARQDGGLGTVFGDGLRCAGGTIVRLGTKANASGASQYPGSGDPAISVRGAVASPGSRDYQVWYRNVAAFCQPESFNTTNGWEIAWEL
jgi:Tol biopolymer transport system component